MGAPHPNDRVRGENKGRDFLHHTHCSCPLKENGRFSPSSWRWAVVVVATPSLVVSVIPGSCLTRAIPPSLHQSPTSLQLRGSLPFYHCCRRSLSRSPRHCQPSLYIRMTLLPRRLALNQIQFWSDFSQQCCRKADSISIDD